MNDIDAGRLAYSPKEVAAATGLHYQTVPKLIRAGDLPARRAGRRFIVSRAALIRCLDTTTR